MSDKQAKRQQIYAGCDPSEKDEKVAPLSGASYSPMPSATASPVAVFIENDDDDGDTPRPAAVVMAAEIQKQKKKKAKKPAAKRTGVSKFVATSAPVATKRQTQKDVRESLKDSEMSKADSDEEEAVKAASDDEVDSDADSSDGDEDSDHEGSAEVAAVANDQLLKTLDDKRAYLKEQLDTARSHAALLNNAEPLITLLTIVEKLHDYFDEKIPEDNGAYTARQHRQFRTLLEGFSVPHPWLDIAPFVTAEDKNAFCSFIVLRASSNCDNINAVHLQSEIASYYEGAEDHDGNPLIDSEESISDMAEATVEKTMSSYKEPLYGFVIEFSKVEKALSDLRNDALQAKWHLSKFNKIANAARFEATLSENSLALQEANDALESLHNWHSSLGSVPVSLADTGIEDDDNAADDETEFPIERYLRNQASSSLISWFSERPRYSNNLVGRITALLDDLATDITLKHPLYKMFSKHGGESIFQLVRRTLLHTHKILDTQSGKISAVLMKTALKAKFPEEIRLDQEWDEKTRQKTPGRPDPEQARLFPSFRNAEETPDDDTVVDYDQGDDSDIGHDKHSNLYDVVSVSIEFDLAQGTWSVSVDNEQPRTFSIKYLLASIQDPKMISLKDAFEDVQLGDPVLWFASICALYRFGAIHKASVEAERAKRAAAYLAKEAATTKAFADAEKAKADAKRAENEKAFDRLFNPMIGKKVAEPPVAAVVAPAPAASTATVPLNDVPPPKSPALPDIRLLQKNLERDLRQHDLNKRAMAAMAKAKAKAAAEAAKVKAKADAKAAKLAAEAEAEAIRREQVVDYTFDEGDLALVVTTSLSKLMCDAYKASRARRSSKKQ